MGLERETRSITEKIDTQDYIVVPFPSFHLLVFSDGPVSFVLQRDLGEEISESGRGTEKFGRDTAIKGLDVDPGEGTLYPEDRFRDEPTVYS